MKFTPKGRLSYAARPEKEESFPALPRSAHLYLGSIRMHHTIWKAARLRDQCVGRRFHQNLVQIVAHDRTLGRALGHDLEP